MINFMPDKYTATRSSNELQWFDWMSGYQFSSCDDNLSIRIHHSSHIPFIAIITAQDNDDCVIGISLIF